MSQSFTVTEELYAEEIYHIPPRILVAIPGAWQEMSEADITLLAKILASVRTTLDAVTVISAETIRLDELEALAPKYLLLFGVRAEPDVTPYTSATVNAMSVIRADRLSELDDVKKKNLWQALKEAFGR